MLSAQIDELRATAEEIDWEFPFTASRLRDAADTIWQLRDDLQRAKRLSGELEFQIKDNWKLTTELAVSQAENAKLRELAAGIGHLLFVLDVDYCVACPRDDINHPCPVYTVKGGECLYKIDLRELGIEVDE